ncbi:MAG: FAD-dependent oxidoreductase [Polaromonas sp.]
MPASTTYQPESPPFSSNTVSVIGAGVVGACVALVLQRAGCKVSLIDALPPGSETSYGNAGLISVDSCLPISLPGMVWQTPKWLLNRDGPLAVRPAYLPRMLPWLLKWLRAGRRERVLPASAALHQLHRPALNHYQNLLGADAFADLIHVRGQLHLWENPSSSSAADRLIDEIRRRQNITVKPLDAQAIAALVPGLSAQLKHGICFEKHAHCINPQRMVQTLVDNFVREGGTLRHERVQRVQPLAGGGFRLWRNTGSLTAERVVVAAGAHTPRLLAPLGIHLPLETERGYHVELPHARVPLQLPFIDKDRAVAVTPMEHGLRIAGTVEFAGLDYPPDSRRTEALLRIAGELFPGINTEGARSWLGFRPSTPDSLPIIDKVSRHPGLYVACGHGHTGLTGAPMTAQLMAHWVTGCAAEIDPSPYGLSRFN